MGSILVLTELYFPEQTSTGYFLTHIAEGLAQNYSLKVITAPATKFLLDCSQYSNYEIRNKVEIFRSPGSKFNRNYLLDRLCNSITKSISIFWKTLLLSQRKDIVLVVTNPPLLPFVALFIKWLKGTQFILLIHDVYPEVLVATNLLSSSSIIVKVGSFLNKFLYKNATLIITLGRDMTQLVQAKVSQGDQAKIVCIPNWADIDLIQPKPKVVNSLLDQLKLQDKFIILYAGNIGKTHGIEYVIEVAKILENNSDIHVIISGFGAKKQWVKDTIVQDSLTNITVLDTCPREKLSDVLNACDVAIIAMIPGMTGISVPSRLYNQMAAGKPIIAIANDDSELAYVIQEEAIGWVVKPGDIEGLIKIIQFAKSHPLICSEMGYRASIAAQKKYTFTQVNQAYQKIFYQLFYPSFQSN